jgi:hypothetical protein
MTDENFSISPEEFVEEFGELKDYLVSGYFSDDRSLSRIKRLQDAGLNREQLELVKILVNEALTDALYTVLLGLEGSAAISQHQIMYKLLDEGSNELTGQLESLAWERFHGENT